MTKTRETPAQRNRRMISGISKTWKIARKSRRPRGLENRLNNCYRNSALQPLLHLPRFVNWIQQHGEKGQQWSCNYSYSQRLHQTNGDPIKEEAANNLTEDCVPCMLKGFANAYWSEETSVMRHTHEAMEPIHRYAEHLFCRNPDNIIQRRKGKEYKAKTRAERRSQEEGWRKESMTAQQCTEEFMMSILGTGCEDSLRTQKRKTQYEALFKTVFKEEHICNKCGADSETAPQTVEFGCRLQPLQKGVDTIEAAFGRALSDGDLTSYREKKDDTKSNKLTCPKCNAEWVNSEARRRIISAPEYMRICLNLFADITDGGTTKNHRPIQIPDILDLTSHTVENEDGSKTILRYKLISASYHEGKALNSGHYAAGVTAPRSADDKAESEIGRYFIADAKVSEWDDARGRNPLTINPVVRKPLKFDPYLLFYEYIPNDSEPEEVMKRVTKLKLNHLLLSGLETEVWPEDAGLSVQVVNRGSLIKRMFGA